LQAGAPGRISNGHRVVRVLAVDARPLIRHGLARLARCALGCEAHATVDVAHAAAALRRGGPADGVVLLGVRNGDDPGSLVHEARDLGAPVVCVLDRDDASLIHAAIAAGADGYLALELADADSIRSTVSAVLRGGSVIRLRSQNAHNGHGRPVTPRAIEVMRLMAEGLHDHATAPDQHELGTQAHRQRPGAAGGADPHSGDGDRRASGSAVSAPVEQL
jgi:DNA-binding NarL/FixJ family response regulator